MYMDNEFEREAQTEAPVVGTPGEDNSIQSNQQLRNIRNENLSQISGHALAILSGFTLEDNGAPVAKPADAKPGDREQPNDGTQFAEPEQRVSGRGAPAPHNDSAQEGKPVDKPRPALESAAEQKPVDKPSLDQSARPAKPADKTSENRTGVVDLSRVTSINANGVELTPTSTGGINSRRRVDFTDSDGQSVQLTEPTVTRQADGSYVITGRDTRERNAPTQLYVVSPEGRVTRNQTIDLPAGTSINANGVELRASSTEGIDSRRRVDFTGSDGRPVELTRPTVIRQGDGSYVVTGRDTREPEAPPRRYVISAEGAVTRDRTVEPQPQRPAEKPPEAKPSPLTWERFFQALSTLDSMEEARRTSNGLPPRGRPGPRR